MIIYGFRSRESTVYVGSFSCPRCASEQSYHLVGVRRWFTLYFMPLIPLGETGRYVQCQSCGGTFDEQVLTPFAASSGGVFVATLAEEQPMKATQSLQQGGAPQPSSPLATVSLIAGLLSPLLVCACGLSTLTSLAAIISGHVALARIKRSEGRLAGQQKAIAGVTCGYVFLLISLATLPFMWSVVSGVRDGARHASEQHAAGRQSASSRTNDIRLGRAESIIRTDGQGTAHGNTSRANELAQQFSQSMGTLREHLFTGSEGQGDSDFITYCELHKGRCAFVVHVPGYRHFDDDAKESLAELAWSVAQRTVQDDLRPCDSLGIGLKGTLLYGAIWTGEVAAAADIDQADHREVERETLAAFFRNDMPSAPEEAVASAEPPPVVNEQSPLASSPTNIEKATPQAAESDPLKSRTELAESESDFRSSSEPLAMPAPSRDDISPKPELKTLDEPVKSTVEARPDNEVRPDNLVQEFGNLGWAVTTLAFSPDGKWLAAGKMDRALLLFDIATGETLSAHKDLRQFGSLTAVAFAHGGEQLVVGGSSGAIEIWNVASDGILELAVELTGHKGAVRCFAMREDFTFLVSAGDDKRVLWQPTVPSGTVRVNDQLERKVLGAFLPPQGMNVLAADGQQFVNIDLKQAKTLSAHPLSRGPAHAVAFSADGKLVACSQGYEVGIWDTETGQQRQLLKAGGIQWSLQFTPNGNRLLSGGRGEVTVWDWEAGVPESTVSLGGILYIQTMAVSADGKYLAAIPSSAGQTLQVFRLDR